MESKNLQYKSTEAMGKKVSKSVIRSFLGLLIIMGLWVGIKYSIQKLLLMLCQEMNFTEYLLHCIYQIMQNKIVLKELQRNSSYSKTSTSSVYSKGIFKRTLLLESTSVLMKVWSNSKN
jgi:hypothetical protein